MDVWDLGAVEVAPHQPVVLRSDPGAARVIAINLPAGQELAEHQVHEHAWLHVHHGSVDVGPDGATVTAAAGAVVHWAAGERHVVRATQDALLLLLLAPWPGEGHPGARDA